MFFPHDLPLVVFLTLFLGFWVPPVFGFWVSGRNFLISGPPNFLVLIFEFGCLCGRHNFISVSVSKLFLLCAVIFIFIFISGPYLFFIFVFIFGVVIIYFVL